MRANSELRGRDLEARLGLLEPLSGSAPPRPARRGRGRWPPGARRRGLLAPPLEVGDRVAQLGGGRLDDGGGLGAARPSSRASSSARSWPFSTRLPMRTKSRVTTPETAGADPDLGADPGLDDAGRGDHRRQLAAADRAAKSGATGCGTGFGAPRDAAPRQATTAAAATPVRASKVRVRLFIRWAPCARRPGLCWGDLSRLFGDGNGLQPAAAVSGGNPASGNGPRGSV